MKTSTYVEVEVVQGLEQFAHQELSRLYGKTTHFGSPKPGLIQIPDIEDLAVLQYLRTVHAAYLVRRYAIPRPKALLGHEHFKRLLRQIESVLAIHPAETFRGFRIDAAGRNSTAFRRLREQLSSRVGLVYDEIEGDLLLRVRPSLRDGHGWEVSCRITPRPLSVRSWRRDHMPGALNATIAAAMVMLTRPQSSDRFLNLMCGSGTLVIERLLMGKAVTAVACDVSSGALACAASNISAAGLAGKITLLQENAVALPFPAKSFDVLAVDLPWGQLVGSHAQNTELYPKILDEAARLARPGARFVLITREPRLLERVLDMRAYLWRTQQVVALRHKNVHPRLYLLQRA